MHRSETELSLQDARFVLQTRTDLEPEPDHKDIIVSTNQHFMYSIPGGKPVGTHNIIAPSFVNNPLFDRARYRSKYFVTQSDHTDFAPSAGEQCIPYECVNMPETPGSLSADLAMWKVPIRNKGQGDASTIQTSARGVKRVAVLLFRGKICDIFVEEFYRRFRLHRMDFMAFLLWCPWPTIRARYRGKYPLTIQEWDDFIAGRPNPYGWLLEGGFDLGMAEYLRDEYERNSRGAPFA